MQLYEELLIRQIGALALEALNVCSADFEAIAEIGAVKALEKNQGRRQGRQPE